MYKIKFMESENMYFVYKHNILITKFQTYQQAHDFVEYMEYYLLLKLLMTDY